MAALLKVNINGTDQYGEGKIKDNFVLKDGNLLSFFTDRVSAKDVLMAEAIPQKGKVACLLSSFWFDFLEKKKIIPTHFLGHGNAEELSGVVIWQDEGKTIFQNIKEVSADEIKNRTMVIKKIDRIIPLRFIVRGYETETRKDPIFDKVWKRGSRLLIPFTEFLARTETENGPVYMEKAGSILQRWMKKNEMESDAELIKFFISLAVDVYSECLKLAESKGVIIAEAKFEFGFDEHGKILLVDEVLNPDCARFWLKEDWESGKFDNFYDKRILIEWLKENWYFGKTPPPNLPKDLISEMSEKYGIITKRILSAE